MGNGGQWEKGMIGVSENVAYLKRTDTTLDLSQKAKRAKERRRKGTRKVGGEGSLYT